MEQKAPKKRKNRKKNKNKNKNYNNNFEYVIGIDLGTSLQATGIFFTKNDKRYYWDFSGAVPTEKILDDNNNVLKFEPKKQN